jgi:hypothetical protein
LSRRTRPHMLGIHGGRQHPGFFGHGPDEVRRLVRTRPALRQEMVSATWHAGRFCS